MPRGASAPPTPAMPSPAASDASSIAALTAGQVDGLMAGLSTTASHNATSAFVRNRNGGGITIVIEGTHDASPRAPNHCSN